MLRQNLATVVVEIELRAASSVLLRPEMDVGSASAGLAIRCSLGRKPGRHCRSRTRMSSVIGPDPLFSKVTTLASPSPRGRGWTTGRPACKKYTSTEHQGKLIALTWPLPGDWRCSG